MQFTVTFLSYCCYAFSRSHVQFSVITPGHYYSKFYFFFCSWKKWLLGPSQKQTNHAFHFSPGTANYGS